MTIAVILATSLMLLTSSFHYASLRWLSGGMAKIRMTAPIRMLVILLTLFLAHLVEIALYAITYAFAVGAADIGTFRGLDGLVVKESLDFFYFSAVTYTSLGFGDVFPAGHLRFIAGVEALNGLLLIAWSASFMFLAMGHLWRWEQCIEPGCDRRQLSTERQQRP